ncbi:MAG: tRNA 2-thiouridine(34) synthase MnmA [Nitrospiraceae bacterium]|nr:tRNA 2-thiouridine(34) synthase MnmA [Nitrospiraceae bacterium]
MQGVRRPEKKSALVALSGGIDSTLVAFELLEAGWHIEAFFLDVFPEGLSNTGLLSAKKVARRLGIRLHYLNEAKKFREVVISYFIASYNMGLTPNPCVVCNYKLKLACGLSLADSLGLDYLATGHYARTKLLQSGQTGLFRAKDLKKDQSYFLHQMPAKAIARLLFPLGERSKKEVIKRVAELGLLPLSYRESQEICFLRGDYRDFLKKNGLYEDRPGDIITKDGRILGRHVGLYAYTIGQRRGLGIPDKTPYYVIALDIENNRLVLGKEQDLWTKEFVIDHVNWLVPPNTVKLCSVQIRHRHPGGLAQLESLASGKIRIHFSSPQRAITPGQFAAFYQNDRVLGGGSICRWPPVPV